MAGDIRENGKGYTTRSDMVVSEVKSAAATQATAARRRNLNVWKRPICDCEYFTRLELDGPHCMFFWLGTSSEPVDDELLLELELSSESVSLATAAPLPAVLYHPASSLPWYSSAVLS